MIPSPLCCLLYGHGPILSGGTYRELMQPLNAGGGAAKLVVERCVEGACVAFDGQAWAIVVLANVHRDKLLGAIGCNARAASAA